MSYSLVEPAHFTDEHQSFIEQFGRTIEVASSASGAIAGLLCRSRFVPITGVDAALRSIADKMAFVGIPVASTRDRLLESRVHQRMPMSLFDKVVGLRT